MLYNLYNFTACLVIFHAFVVICCVFSKLAFLKNSFMDTIRILNSLDPDWARHLVCLDPGLNCLLRLSADNVNR